MNTHNKFKISVVSDLGITVYMRMWILQVFGGKDDIIADVGQPDPKIMANF